MTVIVERGTNMNESKINRFTQMVEKTGNPALIKFWNEIIDDISFWSMVSDENQSVNDSKIHSALQYGINKGKLEGLRDGIEKINKYIEESETYLQFQTYLIEKQPENWLKYTKFLIGIIGKEELWH